MPELFKKIKEITGLNLEYLDPNKDRQKAIKNTQAEIVSMPIDEENNEITEKIKIFTLPGNEEIHIGFTKIADDNLKNIIKNAINSLTQEDREKIILSTLKKEIQKSKEEQSLLSIIIPIILLAIIAIIVIIYMKKLKNTIKKERSIDKITGYSNYLNFKKNFNTFISEEIKANYCLIDLKLDIENIQDTYGYKEAEKVLKYVAETINDYIKNNEMFCIKTNNSFLLLIDYISQKNLEERIIVINEKIANYKEEYQIKANFGVYNLKSADKDLEKSIYYAMKARKISEETNKLYTICDKNLIIQIDEEYNLEKAIIEAFNKKEFVSYVQPIINIQERKTYAVEFLARWENDKLGFIKPRTFLKILEKNNMTYKLDILMFENACKMLEKIQEEKEQIKVFCNFSRNSLSKENIIEDIENILEKYKVDPKQIGIVIEEDITKKYPYNIKKVTRKLSQIGFLIILDNFGGTMNSINDLSQISCDFIKISPKLLNNIEEQSKKQEVLRQVILMAKNLNLEVICENIEKEETKQILQNMNCNLLQGNLFFQAIPIEEIKEIKKE